MVAFIWPVCSSKQSVECFHLTGEKLLMETVYHETLKFLKKFPQMENQSWHFSWAGTFETSFLSCPFPAPFHWSSCLFLIHFFIPHSASCICSCSSFTTFAVLKMTWQKVTFIQMRKQGLSSLQWQVVDLIFVGKVKARIQNIQSHPIHSQQQTEINACMLPVPSSYSPKQGSASEKVSPSWTMDLPTSINPVRKVLPEVNLMQTVPHWDCLSKWAQIGSRWQFHLTSTAPKKNPHLQLCVEKFSIKTSDCSFPTYLQLFSHLYHFFEHKKKKKKTTQTLFISLGNQETTFLALLHLVSIVSGHEIVVSEKKKTKHSLSSQSYLDVN